MGQDESDAWPPAGYVTPPEYPPGYPQQPPPAYPQHQPPPAYPPHQAPPPAYPPHQAPPPVQPPYPYQPAPPQQQGYPYPQPWYPPPAGPPVKAPHGANVWIITAVAVVGILSVLGVALFAILRDGGTPVTQPTDRPAPPSTTPGGEPSGDPSDGPRPTADPDEGLVAGTGPVRVDVYVDYQCPPCSTFELRTGGALDGYLASGRITLRIHPVAFVDERSKNNYATRAAAASACAYESGKLTEFHAHLLRNQPAEDTFGPTDEQLARAGRDLGLDEEFGRCVTEGRLVDWVARATSAAQADGVSSVPAVRVDGREVEAERADLVEAITNAR